MSESQKSLREVADDIKQLIDEGRANEAIPLSQFLLRRFPRYLHGYRLLGEAALEQGSLRDAIEIFRRLLSADPESYVAHAGLAVAFDALDDLNEALWHMMRAFELEPRRREVRNELRHLYERRDGRAPGRLRLNRAALARIYLQEGMYDEAIEELEREIESEADRMDLLVALAEAQWHADQHFDAVQTAQQVLLELPYALKPNLILGEFYAQESDFEQAKPHLLIAQQLDPEHETAFRMFGPSGYLQPMPVPVGPLDDEEALVGLTPSTDSMRLPEWLLDLPIFTSIEPEEEEVDWEAVIAYETDWRTQLANVTRAAIEAFSPDWRVDLKWATGRALRDRRDVSAPTPAPSPAPSEPIPPRPAPAAERPSLPPAPWRAALVAHTREALHDWEQARVAEVAPVQPRPAAWKRRLWVATQTGFVEYDVLHTAITDRLTPPAEADEAGWPDALYDATVEALDETVRPPAVPPAPPWRDELRAASDRIIADEAGMRRVERLGTAPLHRPISARGRWREGLRVDTELWLGAIRRRAAEAAAAERAAAEPMAAAEEIESADEVIGWAQELAETLKSEAADVLTVALPAWVNALHADTTAALEVHARTEAPTLAQRVRRGTDELTREAQSVVESLRRRTTAGAPLGGTPAWQASLRRATADRLSARDRSRGGLTERLAEGASGLVERAREVVDTERLAEGASELVERAQEVAGTIRERATDRLHPPRETGAEAAHEGATLEPSQLEQARTAWQAGRDKEALAHFQALADEEAVANETLIEALEAWTRTGNAPALAHQLLGDLYSRANRLQEAVIHYREALNKM